MRGSPCRFPDFLPGQGDGQVRALEHDQRYEVVDLAKPVAHPLCRLQLVVDGLDPCVGDHELDETQHLWFIK